MAEAVAGFLASALVGIAKDKLGSALAEQASSLWNFDDDLEDMKDVLETISAVLEDAESRSIKDKLVQLWLKRLKHTALDISDMLEDYHDEIGDQENTKKPGVISCLPMAYKKIAFSKRMKSLRERLRKIRNEIDSFNFIKGSSTTKERPYDGRETTSYLHEESVIGRDGEKQEIIKLLCASTNNDGIVIVPIYGLGGMGKSTLAQLVYNDGQFKKYDHRIWVYVSQDFNLKEIGKSIISQLPTQRSQQNMGTQQVINQCLDNLLQGKEVLIVLDDLWEEDKIELDKLRRMLHVKGSKHIDVIVTTRKEEIARNVSTSKTYKIKTLEDDICWEIIKRSSRFELKSDQEKLEQIGFNIAKKCGGVPLAAQAIGFMLASIDDMPGWTKINNSDIWSGSSEDNGVLPSLLLSYERMPPQLRICFSYCAIFPKGHNIIEDELIQQWVALDFTNRLKGKDCINKLLGMSFLQVSKLHLTSQEHVVRYTMHDLVHDLARLTVADEFIVFDGAPRRNTRAHKYCRYSLLRKYDRTMKLANMPSKVRALRFSDNGKQLDIQNGAFSFAKCLRILDFSECSGILLPASIGQLKQLRCLIAPRMQNESLPKCITELSKLQYLNLNASSKITELPESIGNLGCLKYLCLSGCSGISRLPESFVDLKCMVHLDMSGCSGITQLPDSLGNLTNLQHLELSGCSSVKAMPESLCGLTQLQYLNLSSCFTLDRLPEASGNLMDLQYLNMSDCIGMRCLGGLRGLTGLQHLDISSLLQISLEDLSEVLSNLTSLKTLRLYNMDIGMGKGEKNSCVLDFISGLTNLENLDLSWTRGFAYLPESISNLTRLRTLNLVCSQIKSLPDSIRALGLKSLVLDGCSDDLMDQASSLVDCSLTLPLFKVRAADVSGCSNLHMLEGVYVGELRIRTLENVRSLEEANKVKLCDKHNLSDLSLTWTLDAVRQLEDKDLLGELVPPRGLKSMCLQGYSSTSFPGWLMCISRHLSNLVSIELNDLHTCTNLPPLGQLPQLEKLVLTALPSITKIDSEFCGGKGAFRRLSSFEVSDMEGLEEWNTTYSVKDGVQEFMFPVLDHLEIYDCPRLRLKPCPPTFRECRIYKSDQVISSLEEVDKASHHCSSPSRAIKLNLSIKGDSCQITRLFQHFPVLRELSIFGPQLTSVPQSIRHLTSLESLTLECLGGGATLPEWLGDLSSLKGLVIMSFDGTKYLPESMRHLTSLESLALISCGGISDLPKWLGDLSSLKSLVITDCYRIKSLPSCIQQLTKLQKLVIKSGDKELKEWCESEENKTKVAHISNLQLRD